MWRAQGLVASIMLLIAALCGTREAVAQPVPAYNWTGFYVGLETAYGASHQNFSGPGVQGTSNTTFGGMGFNGGYNYQILPQWVVGIQGFYDSFVLTGGDPRTIGVTIRPETKWQAGVDGRLGFLVTPQTLVFGVVGYQWKNQDVVIGGSSQATIGQVFFGGGLEYAVTPTIHVVGQVTASARSNDHLFFAGAGGVNGNFQDVTGKVGLDVELNGWK
jgi:hypothetical protein